MDSSALLDNEAAESDDESDQEEFDEEVSKKKHKLVI